MKALREERNRMHTKRAVRWISSVSVLAATAVGMGAPLAAPASAATETIVAVAEQPRYPVAGTAVFDVTVTNPVVGNPLGVNIVSGPDQPAPSTVCTTISAQGTATCNVRNTRGAGTDRITVNDPITGAVSAQVAVSFESITATADQNVGTVPAPTYLYGANQTANISVTVTGASTNPNLKAVVTSGPDINTQGNCVQSTSLPGNWNCSLTNGGKGGADVVTVFDDDNPVGTTGQADVNEVSTTLTINFELLTVTPATPRAQTQAAGTAKINVAITGRPAAWNPAKIKELVTGAQYSSQGTCINNVGDATGNLWTCTVVNSGRADSGTVRVFDDLDGDTAPGSQEPQATTPVYFEKLNVTDSNGPGHSAGSTATLAVTADGVPNGQSPSISYFIQCGPDASPASVCPATPVVPTTSTTVQICPGTGPWTCSILNGGTPNTDRIWVFDDANNNGVFDGTAGEPFQMFDLPFGDSVTATPKSLELPTADARNTGSGLASFNAVATVAAGTSHLRWTVTAGPDVNASHANQSCTPQNGGTTNWICNVPNGTTASNGAAGVDTISIYNDTNNDSVQQPAEKSDTVKATFDKPTAIALSPQLAPGQHQAQVAVNGCQAYTLTVNPSVKFPALVQFQKSLGTASSAPASQLSACNVPGGSVVSVGTPAPTSAGGGLFGSPTWTQTVTISGDTNQDPLHPGQLIIGIKSSGAGTVTVQGATVLANTANNLSTAVQNLTVVAGGQANARSVSVTPASQTIAQGDTARYTVLVQDGNGTPLPDATVSYVVAAGSPDATTAAVTCQKTDQFGKTTCALVNNRNVGLDRITFFAPLADGETAPAANDPQASATATVQATPPAGSTLTFGCPDELQSDANQIVPACTVSTGSGGRQIIFAAHVADAGGAPLANIPVTFTLANSPAGSTATANQVNTNAKGNALYVVSVPSPAAGNKITVQAAVGNPSAGGLGPATAVATFQAPRPAAVSVTPASQKVTPGGVVNLTGRVTDQFGAGVSGHTLSWAVSGRNSDQGTVTTNSNGAGAFSYIDGGSSGSDTVSVLDSSANAPAGPGTNNPASATVTFGSGGGCTGNCCTGNCCTSNCGGQTESPSLTVRQTSAGRQEKLSLVVTSHPKLVNAKVIFYSVSKSGARHQIGTGHTGAKGTVTGTLKSAHGLHLRFQAKVVGRAGVKSGFSPIVKVHVK